LTNYTVNVSDDDDDDDDRGGLENAIDLHSFDAISVDEKFVRVTE